MLYETHNNGQIKKIAAKHAGEGFNIYMTDHAVYVEVTKAAEGMSADKLINQIAKGDFFKK
jgi:hypothetical protein